MTDIQPTWQINVFVRTPMALQIVKEPIEPNGLPQEFGERRPIFDDVFSIKTSDSVIVAISPFVHESEWSLTINAAPARCVLNFNGPGDPFEILKIAEPYFEEAIDQLSFIWDFPVTAYRSSILDLSDPVSIDHERRFLDCAGYATPKSIHSNFHSEERVTWGEQIWLDEVPDKIRAALRWYAMGSERHSDIQRYMAYWIALELVVQSETEAILQPYKADCGHEIPNCPICNRPTHRSVGGARMRQFLSNDGGTDDATASALWKLRQAVHGANRLRAEDVAHLPRRLGQLKQVLRRTLGKKLGGSVVDGPYPEPLATAYMSVGGLKKIAPSDLDISIRTYPKSDLRLQRVELPPVVPSPPRWNPGTD